MLIVDICSFARRALELMVSGDVANKLLVVITIFPSSSLRNVIEHFWLPSQTNDESFSAFRRVVFILLGYNWNKDKASIETIPSFVSEFHLMFMDWSSSKFNWSIKPFVQVAISPWRIDQFLLLELVDWLNKI